MINEVKCQGSTYKVGKSDVQVRKVLIETTVIPSVLANTETWTEIKEKEMNQLNQYQHKMMTMVFEMAKGTPCYGLLNETGMWPFSCIVWYKHFMWYHALLHSEEERMARKVLMMQIKNKEDESWMKQLRKVAEKMEVNIKEEEVKLMNKAKYKKHVKEQIKKKIEKDIQQEAGKKTKMRHLKEETFEEKVYVKKCSMKECKTIMEIRLNMLKLKANYKGKDQNIRCPAGCADDDTTEHLIMCKKMDTICEKIPVKSIVNDLKDFDWLRKNAPIIKNRLELRSMIYKEN